MTEGTSVVHIEKGKITVRLLDSGMPEHVVQHLEGQIDRGAVRVNRKTMESDVGVEKMTGTYEKSNAPPYIFESIIVSNKWGFVAITRTLKSDNLRSSGPAQKRAAP
jgi:hypothetical protein